jgi:predicted SAM-dependent methyltransferase
MIKLHLGCGDLRLEDFINIDIQSKTADINLDIYDLSKFNDNTVDEIYISHVLEHIKRNNMLNIIIEFNRLLKKNGVLRIAVPDFEKVVKIYNKNKNLSEILGFLNGGQKDNYDIHYVNFDFFILQEILQITGFNNIMRYDCEAFLIDKDDYSKSYLPHMDKSGELMSLNIICQKEFNIKSNTIILSDNLKKFFKF